MTECAGACCAAPIVMLGAPYAASQRLTEIVALLLHEQAAINAIGTGSVEIRFDGGHVHRSLILGSVVNIDRTPTVKATP